MDSPVTIHAQTPEIETPKNSLFPVIAAVVLVVLTGTFTGYFLSTRQNKKTPETAGNAMVKTANEAGTLDTKTFKDYATGNLEAGGINGEGTHKLIRPGGVSQTVYLISSLVDLDTFVGKKVEIYGQTVRAKSAGWLMDVGRIKVIE